MRSYLTISDEEKNSILQKHSAFYDGYATGNVPSNTRPLGVDPGPSDVQGITVNNKGNVKTYQNHNINESVISEKKKDDKWIQDIDMDEGSFTKYCKGKVTCGCVGKALKGDDEKRRKQAQLYLNMNPDKCKSLQENTLKEIEADDMDVSSVDPAYDFKSEGPEQFDNAYSDDSYESDIDSIIKMFGSDMSPEDYNDMEGMMDSDIDGKEMYGDEEDAYDFDSEGGNVDVYYEEEQCEGCGSEMKESVSKIKEMFDRFNKFN